MVKTYYRSEYSDKQWKALIDLATEFGCQVTYGKYGDRAEIDSAELENKMCKISSAVSTLLSSEVAEHIHKTLHEKAVDPRMWKVRPKRYHSGYCSTICKSQESAEHERERLERITGFDWTITVTTVV